MNILVVDDDGMVVESCKRILLDAGFAVITAPDAHTAITLLKEGTTSVDMVLTDIKMPGMDGFSLIEQINQAFPGTAVLMMTGYLVPETKIKGSDLGARGCIAKPFTPDELTYAVKKAMTAAEPYSSPVQGITKGDKK